MTDTAYTWDLPEDRLKALGFTDKGDFWVSGDQCIILRKDGRIDYISVSDRSPEADFAALREIFSAGPKPGEQTTVSDSAPVCPYCGKSDFFENYRTVTALYYEPHFVDGRNVNPDGNVTTHICRCNACGKGFSYQTRYGRICCGGKR